MLSPLVLLLLYAGWRAARAALALLRQLPRSNDDFILF